MISNGNTSISKKNKSSSRFNFPKKWLNIYIFPRYPCCHSEIKINFEDYNIHIIKYGLELIDDEEGFIHCESYCS